MVLVFPCRLSQRVVHVKNSTAQKILIKFVHLNFNIKTHKEKLLAVTRVNILSFKYLYNRYLCFFLTFTACEKYKTNDQCCSGPNNTPATCPQGNIKTYWLFKNQCPDAYAYAYDDNTSLIRCGDTSTNYNVFFC